MSRRSNAKAAPTVPKATTVHARNIPTMTKMSLVTASRRMTALASCDTPMRRAKGTMMAMPAPPKQRPRRTAPLHAIPAPKCATMEHSTVVVTRTVRERPTAGTPNDLRCPGVTSSAPSKRIVMMAKAPRTGRADCMAPASTRPRTGPKRAPVPMRNRMSGMCVLRKTAEARKAMATVVPMARRAKTEAEAIDARSSAGPFRRLPTAHRPSRPTCGPC